MRIPELFNRARQIGSRQRTSTRNVHRARRLAFLLALLSTALFQAGSRAVTAQDNELVETGVARGEQLEMIVRAGFGRLAVSNWAGSWVPFRISVANQGPTVSGKLIVHCESSPSPNPQVREYVKQIQLPTGSRQLHEIAAFLNSGESPTVRFESAAGVVAETSVRVERTYGPGDQLEIGVIDTDPAALGNISSTEIVRLPNRQPFKSATRGATAQPDVDQTPAPPPPQNRPNPRGRSNAPGSSRPVFSAHPMMIAAEDLPREYISYEQLDAVVIGDAPLNQLSDEQARALRLWVASGGLLIVTGAADFAAFRTLGLEPLLPAEPQMTMGAPSLPELRDAYGPFDSSDALSLMSARTRPGARVLLGSADLPIVAESSYGSGLVRFLALNPKLNPYRGWSAAKELWTDLLLPAAESKPRHPNWITFGRRGNSASNRWGVHGFLFHLAEIAPPSPKYVLLFLLAYLLALGPLNYVVLRWKRKTDLAWLTIPAVVISFAIFSVTVAQVGRGGSSILADASLVELHQLEGVSRVNSGLLMMPADKRTQEVTFEGGDTYVNDVFNGSQASSASALGSIECERSPRQFIMRVPMTTWTSGVFQVRSITDEARSIISISPGGSSVVVKNLGDAPITKAVVISADGISDLFDVTRAGERNVAIASPQPSTFNGWYLTQLGQDTDEAVLFQELGPLLDRQIGGDPAFTQGFFDVQLMTEAIKRLQRPLLIGFVDEGATQVGFQGSFKRKSKALYVIHL